MKIRMSPKISTDLRSICLSFLSEDPALEVVPVYNFGSFFKGVHAQGIMVEGGFLVFSESLVSKIISSKLKTNHRKLRENLVEIGVLKNDGDYLKFIRPFLFKNEYEATSVIMGNNKFRTEDGIWRDRQGRTPCENLVMGIIELEINDI